MAKTTVTEKGIERYVAAPDDWPLLCGRKWFSVYDAGTGIKLNLRPSLTGGWRYGRMAADRVAAKLNRREAKRAAILARMGVE